MGFKDVIKKVTGFQPIKLSKHHRKRGTQINLEKYWNDKRQVVLKRFSVAQNRYDLTSPEVEKIYDEIDEFNLEAPDYMAPINAQTLKKRIFPKPTKRQVLLKKAVP